MSLFGALTAGVLRVAAGIGLAPAKIAALPTCTIDRRGALLRVEGGTGVADVLYRCEKNAADVYAWTILPTGVNVENITNVLVATATWDPANMAAGAKDSTTIVVNDAAAGDLVIAGHTTVVANGLAIAGIVESTNTVRVTVINNSAGAINPGSGTLKVLVFK